MAKAMLVMDMPATCSECMLCDLNGCCLALKMVEFCEYRYDQKQKWCPLREVPQEKEDSSVIYIPEYDGYLNGWNDCVKEILGGGE